MRLPVVFCAAVLAAVAPCAAPPTAFAQAPSGARATIAEAKISVVAPSGYKLVMRKNLPPSAQQAIFAYVGPMVSGFAPNVNLVILDATPGMKADLASAEALGGMIKQSIPTYKKMGTGALSVGAEKAAFISGVFTMQKRALQNKQVIVLHGGKGYVFTFTSLSSNYTKQVGTFDKMLASVKWL